MSGVIGEESEEGRGQRGVERCHVFDLEIQAANASRLPRAAAHGPCRDSEGRKSDAGLVCWSENCW